MSIRIALGGIVHETNTFAHPPTGLAEFQGNNLLSPDRIFERAGTNTVIGGALNAFAADDGLELTPMLSGSAIPGGIVTREAFEHIVEAITATLRQGPVDAVVLDLHGALVVDGFPGGDGEVVRRVRAVVGDATPIVAVLDLHANLNDVLTGNVDILIPYDTYPHIDCAARGEEAVRLAAATVRGEIVPTSAAVHLSLSPAGPNQYSESEPTISLQRLAREWETRPGVINVGILFSFPYSDVPHNGMAVVATTDNDPALATRICEELGAEIIRRHEEFRPALMTVEEAIHAAIEAPVGPVVLADSGDNPGGGTSADGTAMLWGLMDLGAQNSAIAVICDPDVVATATAAGVGAEISVELGGKHDTWHGAPIPVNATVLNLSDGSFTYEGPMKTGVADTLGRTAVLACPGRHGNIVRAIVAERRVQALDTAIFRSQGIEPAECKILVVKSSVHFRGSFAPIAARIIVVDTPGLFQVDVSAFPFEHITRPLWPHDRVEPRMIRMRARGSTTLA